jgi:hypothetical protein
MLVAINGEITMCKRREYPPTAQFAGGQAYEGRTMRLDVPHQPAARRCRHFPWWTLWLLWPLLASLKWLVPLWLGAVATVANTLSASGGVMVAAILIAAGLLLIRRSETTKD